VVIETEFKPISGWMPFLLFWLVLLGGPILLGIIANRIGPSPWIGIIILCMLVDLFCAFGFMIIQPNQARVMLLFGNYKGSVKASGSYWVNPLSPCVL